MTDRHMRILRHLACQAKRRLDHQIILKPAGDAASTGRQVHLEHVAQRTRGQVAAAEQRRRAAERRPQASPLAPPRAGARLGAVR